MPRTRQNVPAAHLQMVYADYQCGEALPLMSNDNNSSQCPDALLLETERIVLRRFQSADAQLLFELDSDPEVMRFITKGKPTPRGQIEEEILPRILSYYSRVPTQGVWAALLKGQGEFVGWFHLRADKLEPAEMELGYRLKRSCWRAGLASEGARALLAKGFGEWQMDKICARTLVGNLGSRRVMEKIGLQFEGEFSYPAEMLPEWAPEERQAVKYSLTRDRYSAIARETHSVWRE